jgi:hypothetical protein
MREQAREEELRNRRTAQDLIQEVNSLLRAHTEMTWSPTGPGNNAAGTPNVARGSGGVPSRTADERRAPTIAGPERTTLEALETRDGAGIDGNALRELLLRVDSSMVGQTDTVVREFGLLLRLMTMPREDETLARGDSGLAQQFPTFAVERGAVLSGCSACPICLDEFHGEVLMLPCLCAGHADCMKSAIKHDVRCPTHRMDIREMLRLQDSGQEELVSQQAPGTHALPG